MTKINNFLTKFRYNFILFRIKKAIIPCVFLAFTISLIFFSSSNISAAKNGLLLWANNIIPSLFPFFIATELLNYTNVVIYLGHMLNCIMRPIFNLPGISSYALIMGLISGYPTGAKIVVDLRKNNLCTKEEAERMLAFTNNSGPLFIIGTVGISLFKNSSIGFLLLSTHVLSALSVGILFRFYKLNSKSLSPHTNSITNNRDIDFSDLGKILSNSIMSSIKTITMIGGFVVFFSVVLSTLKSCNILGSLSYILYPILNILGVYDISYCYSALCGIIELTNGIMNIVLIGDGNLYIKLLIISFLLGFGGFSIMLQVYSIVADSDISIKPYFLGKILQGFFACFYTLIFLEYLPILSLNL